MEQAYAGILKQIFKFLHLLTILHVLKNIFTFCCAASLVSNLLFLAETIVSL